MKNHFYILLFISILPQLLFSQNTGKLLIVANTLCEGYIDGESVGVFEKGKPSIHELSEGEHYIQAKYQQNGEEIEKSEVVKIELEKQKVLKFDFSNLDNNSESSSQQKEIVTPKKIHPLQVAKLNTKIPGTLTVATWEMNNRGKKYQDYPKFYYAFEQGDKMLISCKSGNQYIPSIIKVTSYPDGSEIFTKEFKSLNNQEIYIQQRGIIVIELKPSSIQGIDFNASLDIKRLPKDESGINFNTSVTKRNFEVVQILSPTVHYINSKTNISSGNSKVSLNLSLPLNTVEWYYIVTATRDKAVVEQTKQKFKLVDNLASAVSKLNPASNVISIGLDLLAAPPGDDYCDVFVLDAYSNRDFLNNQTFYPYQEGKRINISSGKVQMKKIYTRDLFLGIRNTDTFHGVNVIIEAAAIVKKEGYYMNN